MAIERRSSVPRFAKLCISLLFLSGALGALAALPALDPASDRVGATAGDFRVDESGQLNYSVPIFVAPGTAGMQPDMAVAYSSLGGDGPLGMGWSLRGSSVITRCRYSREAGDFLDGQGLPLDGNPGPIAFVPSDALCLDGQRLLAVTNSPACPNRGATLLGQFRTETESFSRVCAYGAAAGDHPRFFVIERKDGSQSWYGDRAAATGASRPDAMIGAVTGVSADLTTPVLWPQTRLQDTAGNYIDFLYCDYSVPAQLRAGCPNLSGQARSEFALHEVLYTGHLSGPVVAPYAGVRMVYSELAETAWRKGFANGVRLHQSLRLDTIESFDANTSVEEPIRKYSLAYQPSVSGSDLTQLASITECRGYASNDVCFPPTVFSWSNATRTFDVSNLHSSGHDNAKGARVADVDGDGRNDLVWIKDFNAPDPCVTSRVMVSLAREVGGKIAFIGPFSSKCTGYNLTQLDGSFHLMDWNDDNRVDLMIADKPGPSARWRVFLSQLQPNGTPSGDPFGSVDQLDTGILIPEEGMRFSNLADFNGDGLLDVVYPVSVTDPTPPYTYGQLRARLLTRNEPSGTYGYGSGLERNLSYEFLPGDYCAQPGPQLCTVAFYQNQQARFAAHDFNGDGRSDLVLKVRRYELDPNNVRSLVGENELIYQPSAAEGGADDLDGAPLLSEHWYAFTVQEISGVQVKLRQLYEWEIGQPGLGIPSSPNELSFADINGDGLNDIAWRQSGSLSRWYWQLNQGNVFGAFGFVTLPNDQAPYGQVLDINGDGRADLVYPGATTAQGRAYQYLPGLSSGGFGTTRPVPGQYATACDGQSCIPANDVSVFADFDGDLSPDFVRLEADAGDGKIRVGHANNATRFRARDVIEGITTGYGATTFIQYLPTSVRDVYRPDRGSRTDNDPHTPGTQVYGRKSPVQDLRGHAYVVSTVQSDAPTHADDDDYSYMVYRYGGAKIQAGGRGMLGYRQIQSIEANHGSAHVISTTLYHQDFPLIGMPAISDKRYRAGAFAQDACRASPWSNTCFGAETGPGGLPDPGGNQISRTLHYWHAAPGLTGSSGTYTAVPRFVGTFLAREVTYDAFSGACKPITNTTTANVKLQDEAIVASYDTWGNATQTVTDVTVGTDIAGEPGVCGAMPQTPLRADSAPVMARGPQGSSDFESCTGGCVQRKITENVFSNFTASAWLLGRMTSSEVTSLRSGVAAAAKRISHFTYATSGAATGFLTLEHLQKAISPNQDLRTEYVLDTFGNRVGIYTCSGELTGVQCRNPTAVVHRPEAADGGPDARIHRYERHIFDPRGRFLLEVRRPYFDPNAGANQVQEHAQQTITARSAYGEVTAESLVSGLTRRAAFGHLGRPYASEDDTGAQQVVTFRWCQGQGPAPTVSCPPRAVFRQQTITAGAPKAWTYFDRLGRELLKAAENFNDPADNAGFVLKQFSASCQFFDRWGRLERASEPFFLPQAPVSGAPSFNTDDLCASPPVEFTRTQHDVLGRPTNVFLPGSGRTESMSYSGLKTTVTNPAEQKTTTTKNALGEVIEVRDSGTSGQGNDGLVTYYRFDAFSNLIEVRRNSGALGRHDVVSTMLYDALGRKRSDSDPDAGSAQYVYNAAGEIIRQIDGKGQVIEQYYDALGRVWKRRIYSSDRIFADGAYRLGETAPPAPGSLATATIDLTEYDTAANGVGAIASRERSAHLEPVWRETFSYDSRGRPQRRDLLVGGQSFFEQTVFDALGRVFRQRDASGAWTKQIWSPRGFVRRLCASAAGDSDAVSCSGRVFHELIEQTARGQAKIDRRNGSDTLRTTRTYDDSTGWLEAIQSGSGNAIQNLHYTRDALGQLLSREDQRRDLRETFAYDGLNRLTLVQLSLNGQSAIDALRLSYDRLGNICSKKEFLGAVQSYLYAGAAGCVGAGNATGISPHAVTSAHGRLYTYDRNGNQTRAQTGSASLSRTVAYTAEDQVSEIVQGTRTTRFTYGPDGSRWRREDIGDPGGNRTTLYLGGVERISQSGTQTWRRHVGGVAVVNLTGATETVRWLFQDHLGSVDAVTHDNGVLAAGESMSFDAHGRRRDVEDWRDQPPNNPQQTTRGFTGHEQIDAHELVHMNGRVYDPLLGRFIQADPIVQDPYAPQNWNRYTYVYNNPLNGTDPSGFSSTGTWIGAIAAIIAIAATGGAAAGLLAGGEFAAAAVTVAWGGALAGAITGGGADGAAKGAFSALVFFGVGSYFQSGHAAGMGFRNAQGLTTSGRIVKVLAHGVTSGVVQDLQGGKFGHGFVSGALNEAVSPWIDQVPTGVGQIAASALVGGTATKLAGGKFANGAMSGAFARAFSTLGAGDMDRQVGANADKNDRDVEMLAKKVKRTYSAARKLASKALSAYCSSHGGCAAGETAQDFDQTQFSWSSDLFFPGESASSIGLTGGYVNRKTSPPSVVLYAGGIAFQGKGTGRAAIAEVLLHEFRHAGPTGTALSQAYWNGTARLPYAQRPHEIDAVRYSMDVMKYAPK